MKVSYRHQAEQMVRMDFYAKRSGDTQAGIVKEMTANQQRQADSFRAE
jgi:hypothetical protein